MPHDKPPVAIAGREIGGDAPPYVIAEMSANHLGDLERALKIVEAAAEAGCDAVKLQTYRADTITIDAQGPGFDIREGPWAGRTLFELYDDAHMPWEWHGKLFEKAAELGIAIFSAPFDLSAVELLKRLDAPAYKIASFEIVDHELIAACAGTGKPLIISTGLAAWAEIQEAVDVARAHGCARPIVLHCVSGYPTPFADANLQRIPYLARRLPEAVIGLSDHSEGPALAAAAVALGAHVIEKHLTLARADGGPDAFFSVEPQEMAQIKSHARAAWEAVRPLSLERSEAERLNENYRRSLYVVADVKAGEPFTRANIRSIRPGGGLKPKYLPDVLGARAARDIRRGEPLAIDMIERPNARLQTDESQHTVDNKGAA